MIISFGFMSQTGKGIELDHTSSRHELGDPQIIKFSNCIQSSRPVNGTAENLSGVVQTFS